jgi:hypothetical protein
MTTKPFYNAILASAYIVLVVTFISNGEHFFPGEKTLFIPMVMISLVVLSAAIMGLLFFYQPVILLIENKKVEAFQLLTKTIGSFALITLCILVVAFIVAK